MADNIKKWLPDGKIKQAIDRWGGIDHSNWLGYKPFEIRQNYILDHTGAAYPGNVDPFDFRAKYSK